MPVKMSPVQALTLDRFTACLFRGEYRSRYAWKCAVRRKTVEAKGVCNYVPIREVGVAIYYKAWITKSMFKSNRIFCKVARGKAFQATAFTALQSDVQNQADISHLRAREVLQNRYKVEQFVIVGV